MPIRLYKTTFFTLNILFNENLIIILPFPFYLHFYLHFS